MGRATDEDPCFRLHPGLLHFLELVEGRGDMNDATRTDQVYTFGICETEPGYVTHTWQIPEYTNWVQFALTGDTMVVQRFPIRYNGVACIVAALSTYVEIGFSSENVNKFPFAFVTLLGAEDHGCHLCYGEMKYDLGG